MHVDELSIGLAREPYDLLFILEPATLLLLGLGGLDGEQVEDDLKQSEERFERDDS